MSDIDQTGTAKSPAARPVLDHDAVVVGLGFAGIRALHRLVEEGFRVHAYEAGTGPGGAWHWNNYPGARCDVQSLWYSYGFSNDLQQDWAWTEKYATQPEIAAYANHVLDRFDLRQHTTFGARVIAAEYQEEGAYWRLTLDSGAQMTSRYLVAAAGCLSSARTPDFPGMTHFKGRILHTGQWPKEPVDLSGKRIGVIGTGSSGMQVIPVVAPDAAKLVVFQRTANFSLPARHRQYTEAEYNDIRATYPAVREAQWQSAAGALHASTGISVLEADEVERLAELDRRWEVGGTGFMASYTDILTNAQANEIVADYVRDRIRELVTDPAVAEKLTPRGFPIGAKRICVDDQYFETFNRSNVELVDVNTEQIQEITAAGIRLPDREIDLDVIIFATGYDAMTGSLTRMGITGIGGQTLADAWAGGPRTYLGLAVHGFPNLLIAAGPGSPSVLVNGVMAGEHHADWITNLLVHLRDRNAISVQAQEDPQDEWVAHVNEVSHRTLFNQANSWYVGANVPGKTRVFMPYAGGLNVYRDRCAAVAAQGYVGFTIQTEPARD